MSLPKQSGLGDMWAKKTWKNNWWLWAHLFWDPQNPGVHFFMRHRKGPNFCHRRIFWELHPWSFHQISSRPISPKWWWFSRGNGNPRLFQIFQGNPGWWNIMNHLARCLFDFSTRKKHDVWFGWNLWVTWCWNTPIFGEKTPSSFLAKWFSVLKKILWYWTQPLLGDSVFPMWGADGPKCFTSGWVCEIFFRPKKKVLQYVGCGPLPRFQWQMKV